MQDMAGVGSQEWIEGIANSSLIEYCCCDDNAMIFVRSSTPQMQAAR
jgi:hypothetical protein